MKRIISCGVFQPYIQHLVKHHPRWTFEIDYLEVKQHNQPAVLAQLLQEKIDAITDAQEIIVLYGLCGNAILPLRSRGIPLRILRVHDCLSVLLGSRERFTALFSMRPSQGWSCASYDQKDVMGLHTFSETYQGYVEAYGEENARYIMEMMQINQEEVPVYINFNLPEDADCLTAYADREVELITGDLRMLERILEGSGNTETILLHPQERIKALYDQLQVLCVVKNQEDSDEV